MTQHWMEPPTPEQSAAARGYLDKAKQDAADVPGAGADAPVRAVELAGIIGAGTMGGGIAMSLANIGIPSIVVDSSEEGLQRGLDRVKQNYDISMQRGKLSAAERDVRVARIHGTTSLQDLSAADLIIEAVFEDMVLKQDLFTQLDGICRPGCVLATNTSGLDIDAIASATQRPKDVVGAHFFSPAHVQKLLEVVRGTNTAPDVIATVMQLGRSMGKVSVLARNHPGFIGNALFRYYNREAHFLVEDGALPHQVDAALTEFGFAMGIFAVHDLAGNDVGYQTRIAQVATRDPGRRWNDLILRLVEQGRLGQKTGKGWYQYPGGSRTPERDPELEEFVLDYAKAAGIERRPIDREEILERCLLSMVNEGARLLEQGVALRPGDIDVVYVTGYGFPADRGGPMFLADQIGLDRVYERVVALHEQHGAWWEPAPLLARLASEGGTFKDWRLQPA